MGSKEEIAKQIAQFGSNSERSAHLASNPAFVNALRLLMETKGATSSDPMFSTVAISEGTPQMVASGSKPVAHNESIKSNERVDDQLIFKREMESILKDVVDRFNKYLKERKVAAKFNLGAPVSLSVMTDRGNAEVGHMGGEEFAVKEAKLQRLNKVTVTLVPTAVSNYLAAEMSLDKAFSQLIGFEDFFISACPDYFDRVKEIEEKKAFGRKAKEFAEKRESYEDFGSW